MNRNSYGYPTHDEIIVDGDFAELRSLNRRAEQSHAIIEDQLRADMYLMSAIAIAMTLAFGWAMLREPDPAAKPGQILIQSEMTKKQIHDLYINKPTLEKHK